MIPGQANADTIADLLREGFLNYSEDRYFTNPVMVGKFVYHCHIVAHEDNGMMAIIQVVRP
jgi:Multicopper oxidase